MDKTDIMLTIMIAGYGLVLSILLIIWKKIEDNRAESKLDNSNLRAELKKDMDDLKKEMEKLAQEVKDIAQEVKDIDRRLCRIEGSMASKECCMLKDSNQMRKAE